MAATDSPDTNLRKASRKLLPIKRNLLWGQRPDLAERLQALYADICAAVDWSPMNEREVVITDGQEEPVRQGQARVSGGQEGHPGSGEEGSQERKAVVAGSPPGA